MPPPWKMLNGLNNAVNNNNNVTEVENSSRQESLPNGTTHSTIRDVIPSDKAETNGHGHLPYKNQVKITSWPKSATEDDLQALFSSVGKVIKVKILPPNDRRDTAMCFVTYSNSDEVKEAVRELNDREVNGIRIKVEFDLKQSIHQNDHVTSNGSNQLKVFSWPAILTQEDLKGLFSQAGEVERVRILPAREERDTTLAFVSFSSQDGLQSALSSFNGYEIEGKRLNLQLDDRASGKMPFQDRGIGRPEIGRSRNANQVKVLSCPSSVSESELKDVFSSSGTVERVKILPAREGRDITLAFVTFSSPTEVYSAVEQFNNYELMGKRLKVSANESNSMVQNHRKFESELPENKSSEMVGKPWGSGNVVIPGGAKLINRPWKSKPEETTAHAKDSTESEVIDDGIFIGKDEMNENFSLKQARAPVVYIPPPPPEEESEIFKDTSHQGINFQNYENIPVEVSGKNVPRGIDSFQEAKLHSVCEENVRRSGYEVPTPIQKCALPAILSGRDVMACAQTGSGKTAAYLLPIISNLLSTGSNNEEVEIAAPKALIIAPTRELAVQIFLEARKFSFGSHLRSVVIYGGVSVSHQLGKLYDGCDILVATPGRLNDFIDRRKVSLSKIQYLVLDEADRMLDMGFAPAIRSIVQSSDMRSKYERQTLMLSATFPEDIQRFAAEYLNDYIFITVGFIGGASKDIKQTVVEIPASEKRTKLEEILQESGGDRILVFVDTKRSADFLASFLSQRSFPTTSISSDRSQEEREVALKDFRSGKAPVMIATAVAARGLDIADVKLVINFDLPTDIDEYVHRIGRTGRIGNQGTAIAFFDRSKDHKLARGLIKVLSKSNQIVPDWLEEIGMSAVGTEYGPVGGQFSSRDSRKHFTREYKAKQGLGNSSAGGQAFQTRNVIPVEPNVQPSSGVNGNNDDDGDGMWC